MKKTPIYFILLSCTILFPSCGVSVKDLKNNDTVKSLANTQLVASTARATLGDDYANQYFYEPKFDYPKTPKSYNLPFSEIYIPSTDGVNLHGWFIPAKSGVKKARATVVYHHGNLGTMGYHVKRIPWLVNAEMNVIMYDYRGYGKSRGRITKKGLIDDATAALRYTLSRPDLAHTKVISYGHSLGGAKSIAALGTQSFSPRLVAAIDESSFASYKEMGEKFGGLTGKNLTNEEYSPYLVLRNISIPVFLIHGTADTVTPIDQGRKLSQSAPGKSNLYYWEVPKGSHFNTLTLNDDKMKKKLLSRLIGIL